MVNLSIGFSMPIVSAPSTQTLSSAGIETTAKISRLPVSDQARRVAHWSEFRSCDIADRPAARASRQKRGISKRNPALMPHNTSLDDDFDEDPWLDEDGDPPCDDLLVCPQCRNDVHEDTQKCPHCGDWITPVYPQHKGKRLLLLLIIAALVFGMILITVF